MVIFLRSEDFSVIPPYTLVRRGIIRTNAKAVCMAANDDDLAAYGRLSIYPPNKLILKSE